MSFENRSLPHFLMINTPTILSPCEEILCPFSQSISHGSFEQPQPVWPFVGVGRVCFAKNNYNIYK